MSNSISAGEAEGRNDELGRRSTWHTYCEIAGISDFVLQHGVWYPPVPFPAGIRKGTKKYCFRNAALLTINQHQYFRYVEGYAHFPESHAVLHAWNIDNDGNLIDLTWRNCGTAYIGVVFSTARGITADGWCESAFYDRSILKKSWTGERSPLF